MDPLVTIVVVPRERFAKSEECLRAIYEHTDVPFDLIYVSTGSPPRLLQFLEAESKSKGFRLLHTDRYLTPNQARNMGLREVRTQFVGFVDNDLIVSPGWLSPLIRCAEETGAWVVGPLYFEGRPEDQILHTAGGFNSIVRRGGRDLMRITHRYGHQPLSTVPETLSRQPCTDMEFHMMLVRMDVFERLGPLDENLMAMHEHLDLCYQCLALGGPVYFEPSSVVTHTFPPPWEPSDIPFFIRRWSDAWNLASVRYFDAKWGVHSEEIVQPWVERQRLRFLVDLQFPGDLASPERPVEEAAIMIAMFQCQGREYFDVTLQPSAGGAAETLRSLDAGDLVDMLPGLFDRARTERIEVLLRPLDVGPPRAAEPIRVQERSGHPLTREMRLERIRSILPVIEEEGPDPWKAVPPEPVGSARKPLLLHLDDVDDPALSQLQPYAFMTLQVGPGRYECWLALEGLPEEARIACKDLIAGTSARISESPCGVLAGCALFRDGTEGHARLLEAVGGKTLSTEEN